MKPEHRLRLAAAVCGVLGPAILVSSFAMNPSPPPGLSAAALAAWAAPREGFLLAGGWTQGIGSLLIVVFALLLVELGHAGAGLLGRLTLLAGAAIMSVSLVEITFYLAAGHAVAAGDVTLGLIAGGLIKAVQHVFLIAPALLLPLGVVILQTRVLSRLFGWSALIIGGVLQALGLIGLFAAAQPVVDAVLIVQSAWFVAAAIAVGVAGLREPNAVTV
jgi:hypothetical protein